MSCTNSITLPQLKFINNKLEVVNGSVTVAMLPICNFSEDVNEYNYRKIVLKANESLTLVDAYGYKNLGIRVTYDASTEKANQLVLFKADTYTHTDLLNISDIAKEPILLESDYVAFLPAVTIDLTGDILINDTITFGKYTFTAGTDFNVDVVKATTISNLHAILSANITIDSAVTLIINGEAIDIIAKKPLKSLLAVGYTYISDTSTNAVGLTKMESDVLLDDSWLILHELLILNANINLNMDNAVIFNPMSTDITLDVLMTK